MAVDTVKLTRLRRLGFAIETTTGTAATLSAATAAALVFDPMLTPEQQGIARARMNGFGNSGFIPGQASCSVAFSDHMTGIGSGDGVHSDFLLACGAVAASGGVYSFTSAAGSTATIGVYNDGILNQALGAMGNCVFTLRPGEPITRAFTFQGAYGGETDTAIPGPITDPTLIAPRLVNAALTIDSVAVMFDEMTIDLGNVLVPRPVVVSGNTAGIKCYWITNRVTTLTVNPEAVALSSMNWATMFSGSAAVTFSAVAGSASGNIITFGASLALTRYPGMVDNNGRLCRELQFEVVNDSLTITHT